MKAMKERLGEELPRCCGKCGGTRFELTEDGLVCFYDAWTYYLTIKQIAAIKEHGLDKTKSV